MLATKISGLAVDTEYTFHLVLRTTGGTYSSSVLTCQTHKMTDLSGITVTPGILPSQLKDSLSNAIKRIGAKMTENVRIDTTHFVCTEGRGREWEKAREMNIPVVRPEWVEGCEREGRLVGVRAYYLDANPKDRVVGSNPNLSQSSQSQLPQQHAQRPAEISRHPTSPGDSADTPINANPLSPNSIQQLPTASISSQNLALTSASQASLDRRMGRPISPGQASPHFERRLSAIEREQAAAVPEGVADGGPGPEVPPTPPPKDLSQQNNEADSEEEDSGEDDSDQTPERVQPGLAHRAKPHNDKDADDDENVSPHGGKKNHSKKTATAESGSEDEAESGMQEVEL